MIIPSKGRILVNKIDRKDLQSEGGVFMPGQSLQEESLFYGEVIKHDEKSDVASRLYKEGEKVYYSRYSATKVTSDKGKIMYLVSDMDVMAYDAN